MGTTQCSLSATLVAGPAQVSDSYFPSATKTIPFQLNNVPKQYNVDAGSVVNVNSAYPTYAPIDSIGSGGQVTQVQTLWCRCNTNLILQLTITNPNGGSFTSYVPIYGTMLIEFPANAVLTALAVSGSGQFEYWASGLQ